MRSRHLGNGSLLERFDGKTRGTCSGGVYPGKERELRGHIVDRFGERFGGEPEDLVLSKTDLAAIEGSAAEKAAEFFAGKAEL